MHQMPATSPPRTAEPHSHATDPQAVTLSTAAVGGARLIGADSGPGFPDPATAPERGAGTRTHSTGLGLDVAGRVAAGSGGTLVLSASRYGGAAVVVDFGPPRDEAGAVPHQNRRVLRRADRR